MRRVPLELLQPASHKFNSSDTRYAIPFQTSLRLRLSSRRVTVNYRLAEARSEGGRGKLFVLWASGCQSFPAFVDLSFSIIRSFSTPKAPGTWEAFIPATILSCSLSTTPISLIWPFLTMM
jgi:hypothetical protein